MILNVILIVVFFVVMLKMPQVTLFFLFHFLVASIRARARITMSKRHGEVGWAVGYTHTIGHAPHATK